LPQRTNDTLCSSVIIESAAIVTAPVAPYVIALCLVTLVVFVSHAELFGAGHIARWRRYSEAWILYSAGQLLRALAEVMGGSIGDVDTAVSWPQMEAGHRGFDIVGEDGSRRLYLDCAKENLNTLVFGDSLLPKTGAADSRQLTYSPFPSPKFLTTKELASLDADRVYSSHNAISSQQEAPLLERDVFETII